MDQNTAYSVIKEPDETLPRKEASEFKKRMGDHAISLIAKQNERNEWIILSVWVDPPVPGSLDEKEKNWWKGYQKAPSWQKFFLLAFRQIGIY